MPASERSPPRLVVRHVSNGIPGTQAAIRRYFAAQRTTAEEVDSSRSPWHHQNPKDAENGHPAELHPTAQVDPEPTFMASPADGRVDQEAAVRMDGNPLHATIDPF